MKHSMQDSGACRRAKQSRETGKHEGNSAITGGEEIGGLDLHRQHNHKVRLRLRSADRLENRIASEQV